MLAHAADHEYGDVLQRLATCVPELAHLIDQVDELVGWRLIHAEVRGAALLSGTVRDDHGELPSLQRALGSRSRDREDVREREDDGPSTFPLADLIRQERRRLSITQADLAADIGVDQSSIAKWESGVVPRPHVIPAIARFLNRDRDEVAALGAAQQGVAMPRGSRIRDARRSAGLTQRALGSLCGVSDNAVRGWERGGRVTTAAFRSRLAASLHVPESDLFPEADGLIPDAEGKVPQGPTLAKMILQKRVERRISQEDAGCEIGVHQRTVGKWETGMPPSSGHMTSLARWLGVPMTDIVEAVIRSQIAEEATVSQERGRRPTMIAAFGEEKSLMEWARDDRCVVRLQTLAKRRRNGWQFEDALTTLPWRQPTPDEPAEG